MIDGLFRLCHAALLTAGWAMLIACTPQPPKAKHSVDEYRADTALRKAEFDRCRHNPGELRDTPDCINAREAERLEGIGSFKNLPPMPLPKPSSH